MLNLDFLDTAVPQIPGGPWANHAFWGTVLGIVAALALHLVFGLPARTAWWWATGFVFAVCAVKKVGDYINRGPAQGETLSSCIGKTFVTAAGAAVLSLVLGG